MTRTVSRKAGHRHTGARGAVAATLVGLALLWASVAMGTGYAFAVDPTAVFPEEGGTLAVAGTGGAAPAAGRGSGASVASASADVEVKLPKSARCYVGKKIKLSCVGAEAGELSFKSSNEGVVEVSRKGVLKGVSPGKAKVAVYRKATGQLIGSVRITSKDLRLRVPPAVGLYPGQKLRVVRGVRKADIRCAASRTKVAEVTKSGEVRALKKGSCIVKVKLRGGSTVARVKVKVKKGHFKFKKKSIKLEHGSTCKLRLKSKRYKASAFKFTSSNKKVATVTKKGKLSALTPGTVTVTAKAPDGSIAKSKVRVTANHGQLSAGMLDATGASEKPKLMIVAHPDDETLWGGAHMMDGDWYVVCLTNGGHSVRKAEFAAALARSGCRGVILTYPDVIDGKRSDWSGVSAALREDFDLLFGYKDWQEVATYNPDGVTGHIHHRLTYSYTKAWCERYGMFDRLYYFGHFYGPGKVPADLQRLAEPRLSQKWALVDLYVREKESIDRYWAQMVPYEHWVKADEW